ncbi:TonB-dependent receptor [Burkholderia ubonensis]|uniref:TonB-dependent receptor n=1 Tax=Burkholderia ubonensis TaxID=101571 RepID=UPI00075A85FE|nr:TonB-dependent receptor [Burkholderia ubonensis]KVO67679.1 TonB-dependent receptor [Burkholderia ubonensis]KWK98204.1 TonB-dependent receptor [Burkholderia ubonensis]KWK98755.1 TonB-dependent receptor [Burkholderia ubonensis]KWN38498.1 TonB-dependent receptor [Burkholderia ubonensis]ODQ33266.1 TonB-dependent receptor [Burkholderia ubonensis]
MLLAGLAHGQADTRPAAPGQSGDRPLAPIFVTANPLGDAQLIAPTAQLSGDALTRRQADSLGETLNGLPGVSTTTYGPMVGRPIIRGMDGDRIRLLQNGVAAYDASSLSYDHAVPQDPLTIERVEIVRGPAALLYGGNAVGGVVNTIDNRIPRDAIEGVTGAVDARYGGANTVRAGAAQVEGGNGRFAFHVDAFDRETSKLRIPGYARSDAQRALDGPDRPQPYGSVPNSDGRAHGGSVGASYTWADGFTGLSYSGYESNYGSVAADDVRLKMRQERLALASEVRNLSGPFSQLKFDFAYTDYRHKEVDHGETATMFRNRGYEARIEARHRKIGPFEGALGVQFGQNRFSALGDETLVPSTRTTSVALFGLEEWKVSDALKLSVGGRYEHVKLQPDPAGAEKFAGAQPRDVNAGSVSAGALFSLTPVWSVAANVAYTERAPTFYELYSNGPHDATGQFLIGNPNASKEKAVSTDLSLRYASGPNRGSVGVFYNRFSNYLTEFNTGRIVDSDGDLVAPGTDGALSEAVYRGVRAEFYGVELDGKWRAFARRGHTVDLELTADYTHARNVDTGQPLPRIAPLRTTLAADYGYGPFGARAQVTHAWSQHRVPDNDLPTAGYTSLGVMLTYKFRVGATRWLAYLRGDNLTNQDIRYASSVVRDFAPEGGRSVMAGLRTTF